MVEIVSASVVLVVIKACIDTVILIKTMIEDVRFNHQRCQELARSCIRVENVLKQQEGYDLNYNIQYYEALKNLQDALADARDLIYQHMNKGTIHRVINRREYERDFDNLRRRIHEGISLLNLSVSYKIHYLVNDLVQSSKGQPSSVSRVEPPKPIEQREYSNLLQGQLDKASMADEDRYGRSDPEVNRMRYDQREMQGRVNKAMEGRPVDDDYLAEMVRLNSQMMSMHDNTSPTMSNRPPSTMSPSATTSTTSTGSMHGPSSSSSSSPSPSPLSQRQAPAQPIYPPVSAPITEDSLLGLDFSGVLLTPEIATKLVRLFDVNQNGFLSTQEYRAMIDFIFGMQQAFILSNPQNTGVLLGPHELYSALFNADFQYSYEVSLMFFRKYATTNEFTNTKCIFVIDFINITTDICTARNRFCWSDETGRNTLQMNFDHFMGIAFGNTTSDFTC
eukprot:TRINITY_DN4675_c0_g1_i1.p1 TRINITY_DN4675_c0_g1~~TRINITY_DN4675_c0_g1_i1.p1  ORF type:complete len:449 (+),score=78.23 TRINITY_DN4675_c0_g1_i1:67-1413(+)